MFLVRTFYTKSQIIDSAYQTLVIYNQFSGYLETHIIYTCQLLIMSVTDQQIWPVCVPTGSVDLSIFRFDFYYAFLGTTIR
jgi:hypothetical protein